MLIEFRFSNIRSYRTESILSMEARGIRDPEEGVVQWEKYKLLPSMTILGKNGSGKSNLIRAFWLGVQLITHTRYGGAKIPVQTFGLSENTDGEPASFEYTFVEDGIRYVYGFRATSEKFVSEYLYGYPKRYPAVIFKREGQEFYFPAGPDKKFREMISRAVAPNQLYFSVACLMKDALCIRAIHWFRNRGVFTRGYPDLQEVMEDDIDPGLALHAMKRYAMEADAGIQDVKFEWHGLELDPSAASEELRPAVAAFREALRTSPNTGAENPGEQEWKAYTCHRGCDTKGRSETYWLPLQDEADGTRRIMALAPAFEKVLQSGGLLVADDLEIGLHPLMLQRLIQKFQNPKTNPHHAQMIFTTHDVNVLDFQVLRRDQVAFVDTDRKSGASELYQIEDIRDFSGSHAVNSYLAGKFGAVPEFDDDGED